MSNRPKSACPECGSTVLGAGGHCRGGEYGGCCQSFSSNTIGDRHQIGHFSPPAKGVYVPRRCMTTEEMTAKGWHLNSKGAWQLPAPKNPPTWRRKDEE